MNISACIITNNNPQVLKAIESVYDSVSEIILVNTCKNFDLHTVNDMEKVKVYSFKWCDDFAKARNYSISKATGDYILIIDSDEVMENKTLKITDEYDFYFVNIGNNGTLYDSIRIFRNDKGIKFINRLHETVEDSCVNLKGCRTNVIFQHSMHKLTAEELKEKFERNFRILLKDKKNTTRNIHFAKHYFAMNDFKKAIKYAHKGLKQENINLANKSILCVLIYNAYNSMGMNNAGIDYLRLALQMFPMQVHARYLLVNYLYSLPDRVKYKDIILKQLITIGSIVTYRNSELPLDTYCNINFVNKTRKEIEKWQ